MLRWSFEFLIFVLLLACTTAAQAQSVGGSCSTVPSGSLASINSNLLICNGTTWALIEGFATSGNVGIRTTGPADQLDVNGAIGLTTTTGTLPINGVYSPVANQLALTTSGARELTITSTGGVGIGATPLAKLHVAGTGTNSSALMLEDTTAGSNIKRARLYSASGKFILDSPNDAFSGTTASNILVADLSTGGVGIGIAPGSVPFIVNAGSASTGSEVTGGGNLTTDIVNTAAGGQTFLAQNTSTGYYCYIGIVGFALDCNGPTTLGGALSVSGALGVTGVISATVTNNYLIKAGAGNYGLYYDSTDGYTEIEASGVAGVIVTSGGFVGINNTVPSYPLEVNGGTNTLTEFVFSGGNLTSEVQNTAASGIAWIAENSATSMYCYVGYQSSYALLCNGPNNLVSDRRLKKDIHPLEEREGLDAVMKLEPVHYRWKDEAMNGNPYGEIGFIAQDVEAVMPSLVGEARQPDTVHIHLPDGKEKSLNYLGLIAPAVKAIQEQQVEIEQLKADNDTLANNDDLRALVAAQGREIDELRAQMAAGHQQQ